METQLSTVQSQSPLALAGQAANKAAARNVFGRYKELKAANTIRRQSADLALLAEFLRTAGLDPGDLENNPQAWAGLTHGLVEAFVIWQRSQGYTVATVNVRLSTVKTYAKLALKAGTLDRGEYLEIHVINGYSQNDARRIDEQRTAEGIPTRKGAKKARAVSITPDQAEAMTRQPNTPQGRRDALMMCLMLDHGLRVGEVVILTVTDFDLKAGKLKFHRPKVNKTQTHRLTERTAAAARDYLATDAPALGVIWRGSANKSHGKAAFSAGDLTSPGMSTRAMTNRVKVLGEAVGLAGLSAHDCRHFWATQAARNRTPIDRLQDAGGWSSPAMPLRYIEAQKVANDGVILSGND